jgi:transmembrane sensor
MNTRHKIPLNRQILDQAAEFFVEFSSGDADPVTRARFDAWLQTSPEHVRAYLELMPIWEDGALRHEESTESPHALIARAQAQNVVHLGLGQDDEPARRQIRKPHIAIAASIAAVLTSVFAVWLYAQRDAYTTGIGEQRSIALEDGSTVELNARSRVKVRFSETERTLRLLEGQALFQVAKDSARPFIVQMGDARVRALGTHFDIYKKRTGIVVTVVEGKVSVSRGAKSQATPLSAGEQVMMTEQAVSRPIQTDVAAAIAWTQRQLIFDRTPLPEVAEEYNRYNTRQIIVNHRELTDFHVTGVFSSTDPMPLIRFLRDQSGVAVKETERKIQITAR